METIIRRHRRLGEGNFGSLFIRDDKTNVSGWFGKSARSGKWFGRRLGGSSNYGYCGINIG